MKREVYSEQRGKILSLLEKVREGHSLEYSLTQLFPKCSNPLITSMKMIKEEIREIFIDSPLRPVLEFLLKGVKNNRKRTIELSENLIEFFDRKYRIEKREETFRKSLLFRSYIVSATTAGALGVTAILTLFGFLGSNPLMKGGVSFHFLDLVYVFVTTITSLSISFFTMGEAVAKDRAGKIKLFLIGFSGFFVGASLSYFLIGGI